MESNHRAEEAVRGCGAAAGGAAAASAACRAPVPRVFFLDSAGGGRSGAGAEGGVRASASRFEPRKSCSSEGSSVALAVAASASFGCWVGGGSAATAATWANHRRRSTVSAADRGGGGSGRTRCRSSGCTSIPAITSAGAGDEAGAGGAAAGWDGKVGAGRGVASGVCGRA